MEDQNHRSFFSENLYFMRHFQSKCPIQSHFFWQIWESSFQFAPIQKYWGWGHSRQRLRALFQGFSQPSHFLKFSLPPSSPLPRGHDNVHDDMNMYVIMHDQCLFIAMINSFHTWSIAFHSMNSTFMHEPVWTMIITIYVHSLKPWSLIIMITVHGISYDHWSLTIIVHNLHVWKWHMA